MIPYGDGPSDRSRTCGKPADARLPNGGELNGGNAACEAAGSTDTIRAKKEGHDNSRALLFGPSDRSRTCGLLNPIQARYQSAPHPDRYYYGIISKTVQLSSVKCKILQKNRSGRRFDDPTVFSVSYFTMLATSEAKSSSLFWRPSPFSKRTNSTIFISVPAAFAVLSTNCSTVTLPSFTKACCNKQFCS